MEAFEMIHGRRSIRLFTNKPVSDEHLDEIFRAAMAAPSAGNQQPWHFVVIDDRTVIDKIPKFHPYAGALNTAPVAIVVCGDKRLERYEGFWVQDCSAATQNLLLAAHALGLGTVWLAGYPAMDRVENLQKLLGIPPDVIPLAVIALGHPDERKGPVDRYNAERIHLNKW